MAFEPLEGETDEECRAREARVNAVLKRQQERAGEVQETDQHRRANLPDTGWVKVGDNWVFRNPVRK
jgi:hypothetical protein